MKNGFTVAPVLAWALIGLFVLLTITSAKNNQYSTVSVTPTPTVSDTSSPTPLNTQSTPTTQPTLAPNPVLIEINRHINEEESNIAKYQAIDKDLTAKAVNLANQINKEIALDMQSGGNRPSMAQSLQTQLNSVSFQIELNSKDLMAAYQREEVWIDEIPNRTMCNESNATALCNDGTYSCALHHQGACSHHSGVSIFYK